MCFSSYVILASTFYRCLIDRPQKKEKKIYFLSVKYNPHEHRFTENFSNNFLAKKKIKTAGYSFIL